MDLEIRDLCKTFGDKTVLNHLDLTVADHGVYCLMAPSGTGKTTLFRIVMGLESQDQGTIHGGNTKHIGVMFQEDRLIDFLTPVANVALVCPRTTQQSVIRGSLSEILPEDCLDQPVSELSGGMKRRVALARTLFYPSSLILMDEPFTGLDAETKKTVIRYVLSLRKNRTLIVSTHNEEDLSLLDAQRIDLPLPETLYVEGA